MKIPIDLAITALQRMRDTVHQEECNSTEIPFMHTEDNEMRVFIFSFERGLVKTTNNKYKEDWVFNCTLRKEIIFINREKHKKSNTMERKDYKNYVNNHYMTRDSVVPYYVDLIFRTLSDPFHDDIKKVNNLILKKWKPSGLLYIKDKAWKKVIQWNDKQK